VRVRDKHVRNPVLVLCGHRVPPLAAALLRPVRVKRDAFYISRVGYRNHHFLRRDKILHIHVELRVGNLGKAVVPEVLDNLHRLCANNIRNLFLASQNFKKALYLAPKRHKVGVDFVALQSREFVKLQFQNRARLILRQIKQAGRVVVSAIRILHKFYIVVYVARAPTLAKQSLFRRVGRVGRLYKLYHFVQVSDRRRKPKQRVRFRPRLVQLENRASADDPAPKLYERFQNLHDVEQNRPPVFKRHHVYRKTGLHFRKLIKLIQNDVGNRVAFKFYHDAHALAR